VAYVWQSGKSLTFGIKAQRSGILMRLLRKQPDLELFRALRGDTKWTLLAIAGAWTLAAFGDEMVYRGYLMNRIPDLMNRTRWAWAVSRVVVHVGFGLAHAYQGITGVIDEGLAGFLVGVVIFETDET
jgi:membrane protease YdiL (CAAX protease family)